MPLESDARSLGKWHAPSAFHIKAPHGWLNDPCGPGYDAGTGTYHLFYQWNPKSCDWGSICWGHLTSPDGVFWKQDGASPVIEPSMPYDQEGIFTGCLQPSGPQGQAGQLTVYYTSVCNLPFHWTKPYPRNAAGLSMATSNDGGRTWQKSASNPILGGEPDEVVTGFRDPYLASWPALDKLRGEVSLYGTISGGIRDKGPTAFLYAVDTKDNEKWEHLGSLLQFESGFCPSRKWNGDFGVNWECANFMTLGDGDEEREFVLIGSEGGLQREPLKNEELIYNAWCLWMSGTLEKQKDGAFMRYDFGGVLDHGCFYAANSFHDPNHGGRRIVWGWLQEEDLKLARCEQKGWKGHISLQREIFHLSIDNVVRAMKSPLSDITSVLATDNESNGTKNLRTLGIRPLKDLETLRQGPPATWSNTNLANGDLMRLANGTNWKLEAVMQLTERSERVGFHVRHNEDLSQRTTIFFSPDEEEIYVDRTKSNEIDDIRKTNESGPFTLFTLRGDDGRERIEELRLQIYCDGDVVEIFANDRFALSTMVYADSESCTGLSCFAIGVQGVQVKSLKIWRDLRAVL